MKYISKVIYLILLPNLLFSQIDKSGSSFVFAKKLFDDNMYDLAAEQFHQFAEQNPDDPKAAEALYLAGLSYYNIKEYQKAKKEFLYLIIQFPDAKGLYQAQFKIAECFQSLNELSAAANAYRQVQVFYPKSSLAEQALCLAAKMFFQNKEYETAIEILLEFLEIYPTSKLYFNAQLLLAESYIENKNYDRAQIELDKILATTELGQFNAKALLMKANLFYASHHIQQAENDYQKLINKYANNRYANEREITIILNEAYYNLAKICRLKGIYEKSNEYLYKISDYENNSKVLMLIGKNCFLSTAFSKAIDIFQKVISISDSALILQAYTNVGDSYFALKDYASAINAYKQAIELCEKNSYYSKDEQCNTIYLKIAEAHLNLDQPDIAISFLKKYRTFPEQRKNIDAIDYRIAYLYEIKSRDFERAIRSYYDFIDRYPKSKFIDEAQLGLARAYEQIGNYNQALIEYQNLSKRFPASEYYSEARKHINYLNNYYQVESVAISNLSRVIQQMAENKMNMVMLYQIGLSYFKELKDYASSIALFSKVENDSIIPKDELLYYRGRAYQLLNEKIINADDQLQNSYLDSAEQNYRFLIENCPESFWADDAAFYEIEIKKLGFDKNESNYYSEAKEILTDFTHNYPESPMLDQVNFDLGLLVLNNGIKSSVDSFDVYNSFQKIIVEYSQSPLVPEAIYCQTLLFYLTRNYDIAQKRFSSFILDYPQHFKICEAYFRLAKLCALKEDYSTASNYLKEILAKYYYCDYADSAKLNIGNYLIKQQKYSEALTHYMDIYEELETHTKILNNDDEVENDRQLLQDVIFSIATILKAIDKTDLAVEFFQKYLLLFPQGKFADQVLFLLGELFDISKKEEQSKAMDYLQQLENNHASSALYSKSLIKLGDILFSQDRCEDALKYYSKASNSQLSELEKAYVHAREIICLYKLGQIAAADEQYREYKKQFKDERTKQAEIQLEKGDYLLKEKIFDQAEKVFEDTRSNFKNTSEGIRAEYLLGKLYFILNKDEDALEILTDLIKKYPNNRILPEVYMTLGNYYYLQAKQIENALLAYKNAIEQKNITEQNLKIGMHNLIKCYADLQLWDKAIALSRDFLNKFPLSEDAFEKKIQIGYYYYRLNEYDYAIQLFKKILPEADIDNEPRIQFWIGECYFGKGLFQQAISEYLKIVYFSKPAKLLSQYKVTAQYQAAISYTKLGKLENAKQLFQRIITEQGAESVFGKAAKEKMEEINHTMAEPEQGNI